MTHHNQTKELIIWFLKYTAYKRKPDNAIYARSLEPYVRLTFAKSLWGRYRSSTLGIKSWFHSDHSVVAVVLGYLILPPTTILE
jgi:hypothetical protein